MGNYFVRKCVYLLPVLGLSSHRGLLICSSWCQKPVIILTRFKSSCRQISAPSEGSRENLSHLVLASRGGCIFPPSHHLLSQQQGSHSSSSLLPHSTIQGPLWWHWSNQTIQDNFTFLKSLIYFCNCNRSQPGDIGMWPSLEQCCSMCHHELNVSIQKQFQTELGKWQALEKLAVLWTISEWRNVPWLGLITWKVDGILGWKAEKNQQE